MLSLAKSVGLAVPLIFTHSNTLTLKKINSVYVRCQNNWNKNQNHWTLKKKISPADVYTTDVYDIAPHSSPSAHSPIVLPSVSHTIKDSPP